MSHAQHQYDPPHMLVPYQQTQRGGESVELPLPPSTSNEPKKKLMAEEKVGPKQRRQQWTEALCSPSALDGELRLSWTPIYNIDPIVYELQKKYNLMLLHVRLIGIDLKELPEEFCLNLPHIQSLSLENNHLTRLPDSLTTLGGLKELFLAYNKLEFLPERIGFLYSLQKLQINNNCLQRLPNTFAALNKIARLDFECNQLTILPENLDQLLACHMLNVNKNRLTRLPKCLSRMPSLTSLSACFNELSYIPTDLCSSKHLKILRLSRNQITRIPEKIGDLSRLEDLTLDYNQLVKLPLTFWKLKHLKNLRLEGNDGLLDPPVEIFTLGAQAVVKHCEKLYFHDSQGRMRHVIYATQNILQQIMDRNIANSAYFEPDIILSPQGDHITNDNATKEQDQLTVRDFWYGLQIRHLFDEAIPKLQLIWQHHHIAGTRLTSDVLTEFTFTEKEVIWAFANYSDAYGPVLKRQEAYFKRCACVDSQGLPKPCIPPCVNYMCKRDCVLLKKNLTRQRDKEDRLWQAYKNSGLLDAIKRAEVEAISYLQTMVGKDWLAETAYEQAEEMLLDTGADKVVEKRLAQAEAKKKSIIAKFDRRINVFQKQRNAQLQKLQTELTQKKEARKLAREGYMRNVIEVQIQELTLKMANMPETIQIETLQSECEIEVQKVDDALYDVDSSSEDSDASYDSDLDDDQAFSDDDESPEAQQWRRRRERRERKEAIEDQKEKLAKIQKRFQDVRLQMKNKTVLLNNGLVKKSSTQKSIETALVVAKAVRGTVDANLYKPFIHPLLHQLGKKGHKYQRRAKRIIKNVLDVSKIRVRRLLLKMNGDFDEVQRELKYEIYRQYVDHAVTMAREKARKEFNAIDQVRQNFQGMSKEKSFLAWKKWVWTKQTRIRRDLRKRFKTATRAYQAGMESVRSAQIQVDQWKLEHDIYDDLPFWQHKITKQITTNEPTVFHYLPPSFVIPDPPEPLPSDIDLQSSSSSNESLTDWQAKYGNHRKALKAKELTLNKAKRNSIIRSNAQMRERNAKKRASIANSSWNGSSANTIASGAQSAAFDETYTNDYYQADEGYAGGGEDPYQQQYQQQQYQDPYQQQYQQQYNQEQYPQYNQEQQQQQPYYGNFPPNAATGTMMHPEQTWSLPQIHNPYSYNQHQEYPPDPLQAMYAQSNDPYNQYNQENYYPQQQQQDVYFPPVFNPNQGYQDYSVAPSEPSIFPDDINSVARQVQKRSVDEYELAYKAIRKKRNQLSKDRHHTYMSHVNRKAKSFEQIKAEQAAEANEDPHIVEIEPGVFVDDRKIDFVKPSEEELLRLAGGSLDMVNTGKQGMELRSILAQRALVIKKKLHDQAVRKGLIAPKKDSIYRRELRPLFVDNYQFSSSEDEDEQEEVRRKAKAAMKEKRKEERATKHRLRNMFGNVDLVGGEEVGDLTKNTVASVGANMNAMASYASQR